MVWLEENEWRGKMKKVVRIFECSHAANIDEKTLILGKFPDDRVN